MQPFRRATNPPGQSSKQPPSTPAAPPIQTLNRVRSEPRPNNPHHAHHIHAPHPLTRCVTLDMGSSPPAVSMRSSTPLVQNMSEQSGPPLSKGERGLRGCCFSRGCDTVHSNAREQSGLPLCAWGREERTGFGRATVSCMCVTLCKASPKEQWGPLRRRRSVMFARRVST